MKSDQRPILGPLLGVLLLGLLGVGIYTLFAALVDKLNAVNSDLGKAIVTGGVTIVAAAIALVGGKLWEQHLKIQHDLREKKTPVYEKQIEMFLRAITSSDNVPERKLAAEELRVALQVFAEKLIIWGGPEVIKTWGAFRTHDWSARPPQEGFRKADAFLRAIRKELGNSNAGLNEADLMNLFVNDYDPHASSVTTSAEKSKEVT